MQFSITPDLLFNNRQARFNTALRDRLEQVGQEVITGQRSDIVAATNGRVGDAFLLDQAASQIERQRGAANLARARLESASVSIGSIREATLGFTGEGRVALQLGQPSDLALLAERAIDSLSVISVSLNRRQGTRHLFSGTQSAGSALGSMDTLQTAVNGLITTGPDSATTLAAIEGYFNTPGGGFEADIYQGSVEDGPRLHISNTESFDPIPKADDPLFRDILRGFALIAGAENAATDEERNEIIAAGLDLLDTTTEGLLSLESRLGASQQGVDRIEASLTAEAALISSTRNSLLGRDPFEAAAELQALEGQLEASYTVTGRLGSLSILNFLR